MIVIIKLNRLGRKGLMARMELIFCIARLEFIAKIL